MKTCMKTKIFVLLIITVFMFSGVPQPLYAYTPPTTFSAPETLGVTFHAADNSGAFKGFYVTSTVPADLRQFIQNSENPNSEFNQSGYYNLYVKMQLDFKVDNGNWQYASDWDSETKANDQSFSFQCPVGNNVFTTALTYFKDEFFDVHFSSVGIPQNKSYFDTHTWTFRARYVVSYQGPNGAVHTFSTWSNTVAYTNSSVEDPEKLINHAPVIKSIEMKTYPSGEPYLAIQTEKHHTDLDKLSSISANTVLIETWIKVGDSNWVQGDDSAYGEMITVDAVDFFGSQKDYSAAVYQIKLRYAFDQVNYALSGKTGKIFGPYSSVVSKGMTGWSDANTWAEPLLIEAQALGLIPSILNGADLTQPITREEFAELGVVLYEKVTGKAAESTSPNPFNDTNNGQILKAFRLGITSGMGKGKFEPRMLITREQCAVMLVSTLKAITPTASFEVTGVKDFPDQKYISSWALAQVKYMAKNGIIVGNAAGEFMPKGITSKQLAEKYGMATREQAIIMALKAYKLSQ